MKESINGCLGLIGALLGFVIGLPLVCMLMAAVFWLFTGLVIEPIFGSLQELRGGQNQ